MRGVPAWRCRRRRHVCRRLTPLEHPSSVSALRADPPSPTRGEGEGYAFPISTPAPNTSAPPSTTWKAARQKGVCM
ncbi:hypothetical protein FJ567_20600 [Mesorhizobium sp. B2-4-16]|nr:hypothetical protein FJ567_20600 [Mesorhizobium sp. B2-4-16]TPL66033.1 hypothetical protein FJ956_20670 [Mesorhizobium sp. B2-4-3]